MRLNKLASVFGFAVAVGAGAYLVDVFKEPEQRGNVGSIAIKVLDQIVPNTNLTQFENAKVRVVANSMHGDGRFNHYLDRILGEKGRAFHSPATKEVLYKFSQELKKLSIEDIKSSGVDEDELRGFLHYVLSVTDKKYVPEPSEKESIHTLFNKTVYALEIQQAGYLAAFGPMGSFVREFSAKEVWGQADLLLALAFPRTDFQKDGFNQLIAKQYLIQNFGFKDDDFSQEKLIEKSSQLDLLATLRHTDKARFLKIDSALTCIGAFTATSQVAGRGIVIGIDVTKGFNYFVREVNSLVGDKAVAKMAVEDRIRATAHRFLTEEGPDQLGREFYFCGKSYGHNFQ